MTAPTLVTHAPLAHLHWPGPPGAPGVLLLHGIGGGRRAFGDADTGPAAALQAAGFDVRAVDLPGYGDSAAESPVTLAAMARRVHALIDTLGGAPQALVGHSMGGMVALELAASAPQAVAALVLANTSAAFGKPDGDWQRAFLAERLAPLDAGGGMAGLAARLVPDMVAPGADSAAVAAAQALMAMVPEATYRAALAALPGFDRRAALPGLGLPVLVLAAEHDRAAPPAVAAGLAQRIPGARLVVLPGGGHLASLETPDAFARAVCEFLAHALRPVGVAAP